MHAITNMLGAVGPGATLHVGSGVVHRSAIAQLAAGAERELYGSAFTMNDPTVRDVLRDARRRGVDTHVLRDAEKLTKDTKLARRIDRTFGEFPDKNHAKHYSDGNGNALLQTWTVNKPVSDARLDVTVRLAGDDADVLHQLTRAHLAGDERAIRWVARDAALRGVVENDPARGVLRLRGALETAIDGASDTLHAASKRFDSAHLIDRLVQAQERGVRVTTDVMTRDEQRALHDAGLPARLVGNSGTKLHGNLLIADGQVSIVTSSPFSRRGVGGLGAPRDSREVGVVVDDAAAAAALLRALDGIADHGRAQHPRSSG